MPRGTPQVAPDDHGSDGVHEVRAVPEGLRSEPDPQGTLVVRCQHAGCDAFADMKVREYDPATGKTYRWWYLCVVHLEEEFEPWLTALRRK